MSVISKVIAYFCPDHELLSAEVRELGPSLFNQMLTVKNRAPLKPLPMNTGMQIHLDRDIDRTIVVEHIDLVRAIASRLYSGRELAVLEYLRGRFHRLGERVGTVVIIHPRGATRSPYTVLRADQVAGCSAPRKG